MAGTHHNAALRAWLDENVMPVILKTDCTIEDLSNLEYDQMILNITSRYDRSRSLPSNTLIVPPGGYLESIFEHLKSKPGPSTYVVRTTMESSLSAYLVMHHYEGPSLLLHIVVWQPSQSLRGYGSGNFFAWGMSGEYKALLDQFIATLRPTP